MTSLRSMYQKMTKAAPSGSEAVGKTKRQREVCRLVGFLRRHVKSNDTYTNYRGKSPAKPKYDYQKKTKRPNKPTSTLSRNPVSHFFLEIIKLLNKI